MYLYANIHPETKICCAISNTTGPIEAENVILLDPPDPSVMGKRWTGTNWEEVPEPTPEEPTP